LRAIGRVVRQGRTVIFLEGEVRDADGKVCATATATALPVEYKSRRG
jgi:acyl-coenzyme A thioesterase PaaI-like protein